MLVKTTVLLLWNRIHVCNFSYFSVDFWRELKIMTFPTFQMALENALVYHKQAFLDVRTTGKALY